MKKLALLVCLVLLTLNFTVSESRASDPRPYWHYGLYFHGAYPGYTNGIYPAYDYGIAWQTGYYPHHYNGHFAPVSRMRQTIYYPGY